MSELHEASRAAFEETIPEAYTRKTGKCYWDMHVMTAWRAWCRALDYAASRECVWDNEQYQTSCGDFRTFDQQQQLHRHPYCPACGGRVKIQETQTNEEQ